MVFICRKFIISHLKGYVLKSEKRFYVLGDYQKGKIMEKNNKKRPGWDQYFMEMAELVASRSTCLRRNVGAVIVRNRHIIATGYNGAPKGLEHCTDRGKCIRNEMNIPSGERHELCRALHAEQNAIIQAASLGQSVEGGTIYITHQPCIICAKMIINAGIKRIVIRNGYPDELARTMLEEAGITLVVLDKKTDSEK